ncbi:MAG: BamA/TamA family outer membrane protein [Acidobacteriota bacterium]|nr:MAG: BamA/TamA family outer membrane protein [Acidobacteriota bacterium]
MDSRPSILEFARRVFPLRRQRSCIAALILLCLTSLAVSSVRAEPSPTSDPYGKTVKEIRLSGSGKTKQSIIFRELASKVGEPYTRENAELDAERLDQLRIFSRIEIEQLIEDDQIILDIQVQETSPILPILSLDVSDENGFSIGPGFKAINIKGEAIRLSGSTQFGGSTKIKTEFENPWFTGNHASYRFRLELLDRPNAFENFDERTVDFELELGSYIRNNGRIGTRLGVLSVGSDVDGVTLSPENRDTIPSLSFFLGYDSRNYWTNPTAGWWNEVEIVRRGGIWGNGDFWVMNFDVRRFQPLADRHTLALFSLATLRSGQVGTEIPTYLNFHLGGTNTIRGWDLDASRGKNQFINTAEYRYTLLRRRPLGFKGLRFYAGLQLAAFADFGIAWDESSQFRAGNFIDGYGFGLRILIPFVDMIRFDFAFGEPGAGLGSNIGIEEKAVKQRNRIR